MQMKRIMSLLLALVLVVASLPTLGMPTAYAAGSGTCGSNLTWNLSSTGVLTISGTGPMTNYSSSTKAPWYDYGGSIYSVVVNSGVTTIGDYAFYGCMHFTSVTLPGSLTRIGKYAFYHCAALKRIDIPTKVNFIGDRCFWSCFEMETISVSSANPSYTAVGGVLYNKMKTELIHCPSKKTGSYTIPDSVAKIRVCAFRESMLSTVVIPDGIIHIDNNAFDGCATKTIIFKGKPPVISETAFIGASATAWYPVNTPGWNSDVQQNYGGSITWKPNHNISWAVVNVSDVTYTGSAMKPMVNVTLGGVWLTEGTDYTVSYSNNINVTNQAVVTITGKGSYAGYSKTVYFKIMPTTLSIPVGKTLTYNGTTQTGVSVGTLLTVTGNTGVGAGTYTATVSLKDKQNYTWTDGTTANKTVTWKILPLSAGTVTASLTKTSFVYDGTVQRPSVFAVKYGSTYAPSYTLTYPTDCTNVGSHKVIVKLSGNYSGSVTKTFTIKPKATYITSLTSISPGFTVKWNKQPVQTRGYLVQYATNSDFTVGKVSKYIVDPNITSKIFTGLTSGKTYYVRVRTYQKVGDTFYYSDWSPVKSIKTK